ncbi:MAG: hypothetical protein WC054_04525 [Candidatus Nanopelagicales bacterium]
MKKSLPTLLAVGIVAVTFSAVPNTASAVAASDSSGPVARKMLAPGAIWDGKQCKKKGKVVRVGNSKESVLFKCKKKHGKLKWVYNGGERY